MIWFTAYIASVLGGICTLIAVTAIRRGESRNFGVIGWLALIVLSPPVGLLLFLFFGGRRISTEHSSREPIRLPTDPEHEVDATSSSMQLVVQRGFNRPTKGNKVRLLDSPQRRYNDFFQLIEEAEESICIMSYILKEDPVSERLLPLLCAKAERGVRVHLLIDGLGSLTLRDRFLKPLRQAGGQTAVFKPLTKLSRFAYLNYRNHRKMLVIDGRTAIMGGANFETNEMSPTPAPEAWIDLNVVLRGYSATQIQAVFNSDWKFVTGQSLPPVTGQSLPPVTGKQASPDSNSQQTGPPQSRIWPTASKPSMRAQSGNGNQVSADNGSESEYPPSEVQVVPCGADCPANLLDDLLLHTIQQANERLWVVTPFFIPPPMAMRSLEVACRRGVDVRILYPDRTDVQTADYARYDYVRDLQDLGARVFRYPDRVVHAKTIIVDRSTALVGSANFDMRSFFLNYELLVLFQDRSTIDRLTSWFRGLENDCLEGESVDSRLHRSLGVCARLFASQL